MLHIHTEFPQPGSIAIAIDTGEQVRINQRNADGSYSIIGARRVRTVPTDQLIPLDNRLRDVEAPSLNHVPIQPHRTLTVAISDGMNQVVYDMLRIAEELQRLTHAMASITVDTAIACEAIDYQQELLDRIRTHANNAQLLWAKLIATYDTRITADRRVHEKA